MNLFRHRSNESKIAMFILIIAAMAAIIVSVVLLYINRGQKIHLIGGSTTFYIEDNMHELTSEPLAADGVLYIPANDILRECGYEISVDRDKNALKASNSSIDAYIYINRNYITRNSETREYKNSTFLYNNQVYIPAEMFSAFSRDKIEVSGMVTKVNIPSE